MFGDLRTGILLFITHLLACLTVGIIFRFWKYKNDNDFHSVKAFSQHKPFKYQNNVSFTNLGEVLSTSIMNSIRSILLIGGFIVIFSVITSIFSQTHIISALSKILVPIFSLLKIDSKLSIGFISGVIELTNGIKTISLVHLKSISQNIIITSFLLGFGGICVLLQVYGIISKSHISIKPYIIGKVLHGIFAALYTYFFLNINSFFNLDIL